jgi:hypothetical protein
MAEYNGDSGFELTTKSSSDRKRSQWLPLLGSAILIFALLYCSSYLALLSLPAYGGMSMESQLVADYSAWSFLVFQPVDPAIIEEIQQERGLPAQSVTDSAFWPTAAANPSLSPATTHSALFTPQATLDVPPTNPSTTVPTTVIKIPDPTATPQPTQADTPAKTRKPHKTPNPHKTEKPVK